MLGIAASAIAVILFLLVSNNLIKELENQERDRMNIWAQATERLAKANIDSDFEFLLGIISQNNSIPVLICDKDFNISEFRNFSLPDKADEDKSLFNELSPKNKEYLQKRLRKARGDTPLEEMASKNRHFIEVELFGGENQYIYYEDSRLLRSLSIYPYIQMVVMIILALIIYLAMVYTKRAEQNRVWVGLSKETAHQLGTPISSLIAWTEYLQASGVEAEITDEIDKDVKRLGTGQAGQVPESLTAFCGRRHLIGGKGCRNVCCNLNRIDHPALRLSGVNRQSLYLQVGSGCVEGFPVHLIHCISIHGPGPGSGKLRQIKVIRSPPDFLVRGKGDVQLPVRFLADFLQRLHDHSHTGLVISPQQRHAVCHDEIIPCHQGQSRKFGRGHGIPVIEHNGAAVIGFDDPGLHPGSGQFLRSIHMGQKSRSTTCIRVRGFQMGIDHTLFAGAGNGQIRKFLHQSGRQNLLSRRAGYSLRGVVRLGVHGHIPQKPVCQTHSSSLARPGTICFFRDTNP